MRPPAPAQNSSPTEGTPWRHRLSSSSPSTGAAGRLPWIRSGPKLLLISPAAQAGLDLPRPSLSLAVVVPSVSSSCTAVLLGLFSPLSLPEPCLFL